MCHFFLHQVVERLEDLCLVVETLVLWQPAALGDQPSEGAWNNRQGHTGTKTLPQFPVRTQQNTKS